MNRRKAISLGAAAAVLIPAGLVWWNRSQLQDEEGFSGHRQAILDAAVEAIVPETDTPGAKSLGVGSYVARVVKDCMDTDTIALFQKGLLDLDKKSKKSFSKAFKNLTLQERIEVLKGHAEDDGFVALLKELTVRGYNTSEYVMNNIQKFEFIPGRYHGCVPLNLAKNA